MTTSSVCANPSTQVPDADPILDSKISWFVSISLSLANVFSFGSAYTYGLFFPLLLDEFQVGKASAAVVGSLAVTGSGIFGPVSTKICERFGARAAIFVGGLTCAVGVFVSSFASSIYVLYVTFGLGLGLGTSLIYFAGFHILPLYFDRHRSLAVAVISAGPGTCLLVMTPVIQSLLEHFDWRKAMMISAALNLVPCFLGYSVNRKKKVSKNTRDEEQNKRTGCCGRFPIVGFSVLREPLFIFLSFIGGIALLSKSMPPVHLIKMADDLGIPSSKSSWMYFISGISMTFSKFFTGVLSDTGLVSLFHIFQCAVFVNALANFLLPLTNKLEYLLVYACVIGLGEGAFITSMYCNILNLFGRMHGFGWFLLFSCMCELGGAPMAGLIADLSGSYKQVFYTAGTLQLLGAFLPFLCRFFKNPDNKSECERLSDSVLEIIERETVV